VLSFVIIALGLLLFIAVAFAIGSVFIEPRDAPAPEAEEHQPGPE
jgi:hypothetical protein